MSQEPGVPSDNTTLSAVLAEYAAAGYDGTFEVLSEVAIGCVACAAESEPAEFAVGGWRRLEGASDPDDMLSVIAVSCPRCGAGGTLVLGYGPAAAADEAAVGKRLREGGDAPGSPPPAVPGD
jgi:hypothetical protein